MEDKEELNSDKQRLARYVEDAYKREEYVRSHPSRTSEVQKSREAEKRRHESGVEANTQTSSIAKVSNDLSSIAARQVTGSECACVRVTSDAGSGNSPADLRN